MSEIIALIRDYLRNRTVVFRTNGGEVKRNLTKGCPQGSLLGPKLWNVLFDDLIKTLGQNGFEKVVVCADDGAIVFHGNTRKKIQEQGQRAVNIVEEWCEGRKMKLPPSKTVMMLLRGKLNIGRPPNIYLDGKPLKMVSEKCYLGITFEAGIMGPKIRKHVIKVAKKYRTLFGSLRRIAKRDWGLNYRALEIKYKGLFVPIATYAAAAWNQIANERDWRTLTLAQRHALIGVTRAYRTVPAEAMQVLAGVLPIRLEVEKRAANYRIKKGIAFQMNSHENSPQKVLECWQHRWDETEKGKVTREFFPSIIERMKMNWIKPNHYTSQFLTGHGDFKPKLTKLGIAEESKCTCEEEEINTHILLTCNVWTQQRQDLKNYLQKVRIPWPPTLGNLMRKEVYKHFEELEVKMVKDKEQANTE